MGIDDDMLWLAVGTERVVFPEFSFSTSQWHHVVLAHSKGAEASDAVWQMFIAFTCMAPHGFSIGRRVAIVFVALGYHFLWLPGDQICQCVIEGLTCL